MVPEGWSDKPVGERLKLASGSARPEDTQSEPSATARVPVYGGNGVLGYCTESNWPSDAIVIGRVGEKCGITRYVSGPIWISDNALYTREIASDTDIRFLTYRLQHFDLSRLRKKGGQPLVTQKPIYALKVPFPPLPEQKKIAEILSTWDKAIETTEKLLANAEAQKRALMQQLLTGKRRLKGFEGSEWRPVALGDALVIEYGKSPKAIISTEGRYPVIGTGGETGRTDEFLVDTPAIVIGRKGTIDKPTMIEVPFWPIDTTFSCIARRGFDIRWVFRALQRVDLRRYNEASGVPSLSRDTLRSIHLVAPGKDEQAAIRAVIDHADEECTTIRRDVELLQAQKRALMQQLLIGKRRVTV